MPLAFWRSWLHEKPNIQLRLVANPANVWSLGAKAAKLPAVAAAAAVVTKRTLQHEQTNTIPLKMLELKCLRNSNDDVFVYILF